MGQCLVVCCRLFRFFLGAAFFERFSGTRMTRMNADFRGFFLAKKSDSGGHGLDGFKMDLNGFFFGNT